MRVYVLSSDTVIDPMLEITIIMLFLFLFKGDGERKEKEKKKENNERKKRKKERKYLQSFFFQYPLHTFYFPD